MKRGVSRGKDSGLLSPWKPGDRGPKKNRPRLSGRPAAVLSVNPRRGGGHAPSRYLIARDAMDCIPPGVISLPQKNGWGRALRAGRVSFESPPRLRLRGSDR